MKKIGLLLIIVIFLVGCGKELKTNNDFKLTSNYNQSNIDKSTEENKINEDNINNLNTNNLSNSNNISSNNDISNNDKIVISYIENIDQKIDNLLKKNKNEKTENKVKGIFITLVDFVFYDGEIKEISFNDLTKEGKEKVLFLINAIDIKIEKYFPGYKENISSKASSAFLKASELIKKGAYDINNFTKEKLGKENYQEIINAKEELFFYTNKAFSIVSDFSNSLFNNLKDSFNDWYINFKKNN